MIDVDWSSLMPKQPSEPRTPGAALLRFTPGAVLLRAGVSRRLAGPQLIDRVREACRGELGDPKGLSGLVCLSCVCAVSLLASPYQYGVRCRFTGAVMGRLEYNCKLLDVGDVKVRP